MKVVTPEGFGASFTDQKIRARFVKKGILTKASTLKIDCLKTRFFEFEDHIQRPISDLTPQVNLRANHNSTLTRVTQHFNNSLKIDPKSLEARPKISHTYFNNLSSNLAKIVF